MVKDINWYMERGFSREMAEYYVSGRKELIKVTPYPAGTLILEYGDGERRILDCRKILNDRTREFLQEYENFSRVYLEDGVICWDIDPKVDSKQVWENHIDVILSHTCPYQYVPREALLPMIDQDSVDNSTERWLDTVEEMVDYKAWFCGHWHINKRIDKMHFLFGDVEAI